MFYPKVVRAYLKFETKDNHEGVGTSLLFSKPFFLLCFQSIQLTHDFLENIVCRITYHLAIKLKLVKGLTLNQNLEFKGKAIIYLLRHMLANVMFTRSPKKSKTHIQTLTLLFSEYRSICDHSSNDEK